MKSIQTYMPLVCNTCWSKQAYYNEVIKRLIRHGKIEIIFSQMQFLYAEYCDITSWPKLDIFFTNEFGLISLILQYAFPGGISHLHYSANELRHTIYGADCKHFVQQQEKMYNQWYRQHHIIKEILQKYVEPYIYMDKFPQVVFNLFNLSVFNEKFYASNNLHFILNNSYIANYRLKKNQISEEEEKVRQDEMRDYLNCNFKTRLSGEDFETTSSEECNIDDLERSTTPSI